MKTLTEGLAAKLIKTWLERLPARLPEDQLNCTLKQVSAMQAEIDELRAALQERDAEIADIKENQFPKRIDNVVKPLLAEIERLKRTVEETASGPLSEEAYDIAQSKIEAQRKVLEQALESLELCSIYAYAGGVGSTASKHKKAITTIQEVLK